LRAFASSALVKVVRTGSGNNSAVISRGTPGESCFQNGAVSTVVMLGAAFGDLNAFLLGGAP